MVYLIVMKNIYFIFIYFSVTVDSNELVVHSFFFVCFFFSFGHLGAVGVGNATLTLWHFLSSYRKLMEKH